MIISELNRGSYHQLACLVLFLLWQWKWYVGVIKGEGKKEEKKMKWEEKER